MTRQTTLSIWCERLIEACWLLALTLVPIYFNLFSARHFEPDKINALRSIVLVMAALGLVRALELWNIASNRAPAVATPEPADGPALKKPSFWQRFNSVPLALPTTVYILVFLFTTITSVVPLTSFWGSYQRGQGTYTNLSYILLALMIVVTMRRREQLERLITIVILTGTAVAGYGVLQHFGLDPLPWRGDVISRVASTMGNSIFVAAYMIMVVPLALYRFLGSLSEARSAPEGRGGIDWAWIGARGLLIFAGLALILSVIKFGAAVRTVDFRYWWFFPGIVAITTALWWLLTVPLEQQERPPLWPGFVFLGFLIFFGLFFALSSAAGIQVAAGDLPTASDWWLWLLLALIAVISFYGLALALPRRNGAPSRLTRRVEAGAALLAVVLLLVAIFFTQSRGPWFGIMAGLSIFSLLALLQGMRHARRTEQPKLLGLLRGLLIAGVVVVLSVGGFLTAFNLSDAPFFQQLREVPYLGRMGQLLEVDSGTGKVRVLIWFGDEHAGGATGLITSDPLRTIIGYGPESMFVAYNPFYPPALATIESRGASPDRSHQAWLDELITKGILGLASYFFVLGSYFWIAWRYIRRSDDWRWQVFFIACLSAVAGHAVEVLVGIPIASTLMMLWVMMALTIVGAHIAGLVHIGRVGEPTPPVVEAPVTAPNTKQPAGRRQPAPRGAVARGAARSRPTGAAARGQGGGAAVAVYGLIGTITLVAVWWFNLNPVYADMRFQQGQALADRSSAGINGLIQGMDDYLATIRANPREDFYYLNLGRILMSIADTQRASGVDMGEPKADARVRDLTDLEDVGAVQGFVQNAKPLQLMSYAEAVLTEAHELNSLNKDHFANLGRLNNFWYSWTRDPERLRIALQWYERVMTVAPQDVSLINERVGVMMTMADYLKSVGNQTEADGYYQQAQQLLDRSRTLDQRYIDTDVRLGDLLRAQGRYDEAIDRYLAVLERSPQSLNSQVERIAAEMRDRPELVRKLRDGYNAVAAKGDAAIATNPVASQVASTALLHAISGLLSVRVGDLSPAAVSYARAAELAPNNYDYVRNYTIVLSDTMQYDLAITQANRALTLLQSQQGREREAAQIQALIAYLQGK
jgi:tetratricopeptide (TPR) repeat protein